MPDTYLYVTRPSILCNPAPTWVSALVDPSQQLYVEVMLASGDLSRLHDDISNKDFLVDTGSAHVTFHR